MVEHRRDRDGRAGVTGVRRRVGYAAAGVALATLGGYVALGVADVATRLAWLAASVVVIAFEFGTLVAHLHENHAPDERRPRSRLGSGNLLTLARGAMLAWLAGFLFVPWRGTALAWLPTLLYGTAAILDALDGAVARRFGAVTALGGRLDMAFDSLGLLVATLVGVVAGRLPVAYLAVGLARYAFVAAVLLRKRRGLPVRPLPARASRRPLAGVQMAFVAVALTPVVPTAAVRVGAFVVGAPLLVGFLRDWLYASGRLVESETRQSTSSWWAR